MGIIRSIIAFFSGKQRKSNEEVVHLHIKGFDIIKFQYNQKVSDRDVVSEDRLIQAAVNQIANDILKARLFNVEVKDFPGGKEYTITSYIALKS